MVPEHRFAPGARVIARHAGWERWVIYEPDSANASDDETVAPQDEKFEEVWYYNTETGESSVRRPPVCIASCPGPHVVGTMRSHELIVTWSPCLRPSYSPSLSCCMVLHGVAWCCIALHRVAWCCVGLHRVVWCCMVLCASVRSTEGLGGARGPCRLGRGAVGPCQCCRGAASLSVRNGSGPCD
jgi:hypothetical protein